MSPHLPRMDNSASMTDGESPTGFKRDFLHFLEQYGSRMKHWRKLVSRADCSAINVAFVGSIPGFYDIDDTEWGHQKLGKLLHKHMVIPENEPRMSIVVQASSIGSLTANYKEWIRNQLLVAMDVKKKSTVYEHENMDGDAPVFKLIFPTISEYNQSIDKSQSSHCSSNDECPAQRWIEKHMQWVRERFGFHLKNLLILWHFCILLSHSKKMQFLWTVVPQLIGWSVAIFNVNFWSFAAVKWRNDFAIRFLALILKIFEND